uniref:(northern house mosquito) hypothetical protein n=1 Tax=Culex pipiens TaxID=7175 RepID=A0A8D8FJH0_CULPI
MKPTITILLLLTTACALLQATPVPQRAPFGAKITNVIKGDDTWQAMAEAFRRTSPDTGRQHIPFQLQKLIGMLMQDAVPRPVAPSAGPLLGLVEIGNSVD